MITIIMMIKIINFRMGSTFWMKMGKHDAIKLQLYFRILRQKFSILSMNVAFGSASEATSPIISMSHRSLFQSIPAFRYEQKHRQMPPSLKTQNLIGMR